MNGDEYGRNQRDYISFSSEDKKLNRFRNDYTPTYQDEYGMRHWSEDNRSEASHESHFGKGPKGYVRSAERIKEEANEILTKDWALDASDIEVEFSEGDLILKGEVLNRHDKRLAEDLVENISGVDDVINQLIIRK
jgi:osmotically-inducible protein OsmY